MLGADELPPLEACVNTFDYELVAQKKMALTGKEKGWAYYASGGDDETTMRDNISAFHRIWLRPRILRDVSAINTETMLLNQSNHDGKPFSFPIYLSSVALQVSMTPTMFSMKPSFVAHFWTEFGSNVSAWATTTVLFYIKMMMIFLRKTGSLC